MIPTERRPLRRIGKSTALLVTLLLWCIAGSPPLLAQGSSAAPTTRPEPVLQIGHSGAVTSVAFSPELEAKGII